MRRLLPLVAVAATICSEAFAQQTIDYSKLDITTTELGHDVYLLNWRGGDSLFLVGDAGVLLVDTAVAPLGDKIRSAIRQVTSKPVTLVINTHAHADHFGANELMGRAGALIVGHDKLRERMVTGQYLAVFNQTIPPSPAIALPTITYSDRMTLHFGGETIELIHVANAHTDNDTLVHFRRANVIHASGTVGDAGYPFFDLSSDGSLSGTIAAEAEMLSMSDAQTRIVPDEGAPAGKAFLKTSHDALVTVRARVQKLIDQGRTEAETIAAQPTKDLDAPFVHQGSFLSGDVMTRMAYQSLKGIKPPPRPQ